MNDFRIREVLVMDCKCIDFTQLWSFVRRVCYKQHRILLYYIPVPILWGQLQLYCADYGVKINILSHVFIHVSRNPGSHNCFGSPSLLVEGLLTTGPNPSSFYLLVEMRLPLHLYPAYIWWELDQLFIKKQQKNIKIWN